MTRFLRQHGLNLLFILLIGMIPLLWFGRGELITGGDVVYPLDPAGWVSFRTHMWNYRVNAGFAAAVNATTLIFHRIQAFFVGLGCSVPWAQRWSYVFWNLAICSSIYSLLWVTRPAKSSGRLYLAIGILLYAFNPFLFNSWESGKASILSAFFAFPAILTILIGIFQRQWRVLPSLACVVPVAIVAASIGADPPVCALLLLLVAISVLVLGWPGKNEPKPLRTISRLIWIGIWLIVVLLAASSSWLIPYGWELAFKASASAGSGLAVFQMADWLKGISTHTSLFNVSRLQATWDWYYTWNNEPYISYAARYFSNPFLIGISILWPLLAYGALFGVRDRVLWLFSILALIGTFGAAGAHPPSGGVFLWLADHCPGFFVFRSPYYKFGILVPLAYAVLVPRGWEWISARIQKPSKKIVGIALLLCNLVYAYPLFSGEIVYTHEKLASIRLKVPGYIYQVSDWLQHEAAPGKILSLPQEGADMYTWRYGSLAHLLTLISDRAVFHGIADNEPGGKIRNLCVQAVYQGLTPYAAHMLDWLGVRYLLIRKDSWYDFYGDTDSPAWIAGQLQHQQGITPARSIGPWEFYTVESPAHKPLMIHSSLSVWSGSADGLYAASYPVIRQSLQSLLLLNRPENKTIVEQLNVGSPESLRWIFYSSSPADLGLELVSSGLRIPYDSKKHQWEFSIKNPGYYEIWIVRPDAPARLDFSALLLDEQQLLLPDAHSEFAKIPSFCWIRLTPKYLIPGNHLLRPLEPTLMDEMPGIVAVPRNDLLESVQFFAKSVEASPHPLTYIQKTEPCFERPTRPMVSAVVAQPFGFEPGGKTIQGHGNGWQWLHINAGYRIHNQSSEPVITHFQAEIFAPLDRTLYMNMDGQLIKHFRLKAGTVFPLIFDTLSIPPGEHKLTFYVLEGGFLPDGISPANATEADLLTLAVRAPGFDSADLQADFQIGRSGEYAAHFYPFPIAGNGQLDRGNRVADLDGKSISLNSEDAASSAWTAGPVQLEKGVHQIRIPQQGSERYWIILQEQLPEKLPAMDASAWQSDDPTRYRAGPLPADPSIRFLVTQDGYDPAWRVKMIPEERAGTALSDHFEANGYSNAWIIDPTEEPARIEVDYFPQQLFRIGSAITTAVAAIAIFILLAALVKRPR